MAPIKLFRTTQKYFDAMGFYPPSQLNQPCEFNRKNRFYIFIVTGMLIPTSGFLLFKAKSAYEYSNCCYILLTYINNSILHAILLYKMGSIRNLIKKYQEFIEERLEYKPTSIARYTELDTKIELASEWTYIVLVEVFMVGLFLPFVLLSIVNYFALDLGDESFFLPVPLLLPFDWKTPFGYFIALVAEFTTAYSMLFSCTAFISFFIGSAWLAIAIIKDITNDLAELNAISQASSENNRGELKKRFCHIIRFYSDAKQFIDDFGQIYKFVITSSLLWALLTIASALLLFQSQLSAENMYAVESIFALNMICCTSLYTFLFCEFGQLVSDQFDLFDDELYQCNWYAFPIEMQRLLLTFMSNTQRPAIFLGYGGTECSRDTYKKTMKCGFSYFMSLRSISG